MLESVRIHIPVIRVVAHGDRPKTAGIGRSSHGDLLGGIVPKHVGSCGVNPSRATDSDSRGRKAEPDTSTRPGFSPDRSIKSLDETVCDSETETRSPG